MTKLQRLIDSYQHEENQQPLDDFMAIGRPLIVPVVGNEAGKLIGLAPEEDGYKSETSALMKAIIALNKDMAAKGSDIVVSQDGIIEFFKELFDGRSR